VSDKKKGMGSGTNLGFATITALAFANQLSATFQNVNGLTLFFCGGL
jgi:hypothetical protein